MYKIRGIILNKQIEDITSKSGDTFKKMYVTIEEQDSGYSYTHQFEIFGEDNINKQKENIIEGRMCKIDFYIKSNEWKGKYFNTLNIKSINLEDDTENPF
tara:strand:+ start:1087 stop:1386 length:300 start_codon:yes stop_codon:yes gene_type:complete